MRSSPFLGVLFLLAPVPAWSQAPVVEIAYVAIIPAGTADVDSVIGLQRGVEIVLCQSGIRQRFDGSPGKSELKLVASLTKADFVVDAPRRQVVRECELTGVTATLPDGATIELPDTAITTRSGMPAGNAESFFVACGANFVRNALDALKDKLAVRGSSCVEQPAVQPVKKKKK